MKDEANRTFLDRFKTWFGLGALMFGTFCGANMASGVYAANYIVTFGGGWALVWLGMFFVALTFYTSVGLNFARAYKVSNYKDFYVALWGAHRENAPSAFKKVVVVFFDVFTLCSGVINVSATIALFSELMNKLFQIPVFWASAAAVLLFAVLTMYGASFLRKFNTAMTVSLLVCMVVILIAVCSVRGDVLMERIGNFNIGLDWSGEPLKAHFLMFSAYCFNISHWGGTLSTYSDQVRDGKDAMGSGITIAVLVCVLFALTGAIVLPFMPDVLGGTPILQICQENLSPILTGVYWVVVIFSVVSTAPTFTFNVTKRWSGVWKSEKVSQRTKFFVIAISFLLVCWLLSSVGLVAIVKKGYTAMGKIAVWAIAIPLVVSIPRVFKKDRTEKASLQAQNQK